jgi:hypothetical protein
MFLGQIRVRDFLARTQGKVRGDLVTDAKMRYYAAEYNWEEDKDDPEYIWVSRRDGNGDRVKMRAVIDLDESQVSFFGLYSGDGAKGSEDATMPGKVEPTISFSQKEPNLILFATRQFQYLFSGSIRFTFSLGEDSAYFMAGEGYKLLKQWYGGNVPATPSLSEVRPRLDRFDEQYLQEVRPVSGTNEQHLAFYYAHKHAMEKILAKVKGQQIAKAGIQLSAGDRVTASMRRPFKKGAREPGGSSRADETHVGGVRGLGALFLKMLHEIESSIYTDSQESLQGLIRWIDIPSTIGKVVDIEAFFLHHDYGRLGGRRPAIVKMQPTLFSQQEIAPERTDGLLKGLWPLSKWTPLHSHLRIDPLWCYTSGLYLAEGTTDKSLMFSMFRTTSDIIQLESTTAPDTGEEQELTSSPKKKTPARKKNIGLGFTSSENMSLELMLRALQKLFPMENSLDAWKVKVGSQYFPELVVIGLKNGVPMLRGGKSGDGKLRTMEISLSVKEWALAVAPCMQCFAERYSHVEPTGAGVPRIDFWASSSLCKWYFPIVMYATFGETVLRPDEEFCV